MDCGSVKAATELYGLPPSCTVSNRILVRQIAQSVRRWLHNLLTLAESYRLTPKAYVRVLVGCEPLTPQLRI